MKDRATLSIEGRMNRVSTRLYIDRTLEIQYIFGFELSRFAYYCKMNRI